MEALVKEEENSADMHGMIIVKLSPLVKFNIDTCMYTNILERDLKVSTIVSSRLSSTEFIPVKDFKKKNETLKMIHTGGKRFENKVEQLNTN